MRRVELMAPAERDLADLPPDVRQRILRRLIALRDSDMLASGVPLSGGLRGLQKLRFGSHRLIYQELDQGNLIMVWGIGHRSRIYETMRRRVGQ